MPVAVNCLVNPIGVLGLKGVTAIELKVAAVTSNLVLPDRASNVAVMSDEPTVMPLARPFTFTMATSVSPDDQVADEVMSLDVPSE